MSAGEVGEAGEVAAVEADAVEFGRVSAGDGEAIDEAVIELQGGDV